MDIGIKLDRFRKTWESSGLDSKKTKSVVYVSLGGSGEIIFAAILYYNSNSLFPAYDVGPGSVSSISHVLRTVSKGSGEWNKVRSVFRKTLNKSISRIERIENKLQVGHGAGREGPLCETVYERIQSLVRIVTQSSINSGMDFAWRRLRYRYNLKKIV